MRLLQFTVIKIAVQLLGYTIRLLGYAIKLYRFIKDNDAMRLLQFTLRGDAVSVH